MEAALPDTVAGDCRREAVGTYAAMPGALIPARAIDDLTLSDETREWLDHDA